MTIQELQQKYGQSKPATQPTAQPTGVGMLEAKYGKSSNGFPTAQPPTVSQSFNDKLNSLLTKPAFDMSKNQSGFVGTTAKSVVNSGQSLAKFGKGVVDFLNPVNTAKNLINVPGEIWETAKSQVSANTSQEMADRGLDAVLKRIQEKKAKGEDATKLETYLKQAVQDFDPKTQGTISQILADLGKASYESVAPPAVQEVFKGEGTKALQSVAEDPYQLAPLFLVAKGLAEKKMIAVVDSKGKPVLNAKGEPTYKSALETKVGEKIDKGISKVAEIASKPITVPAKGAIKIGRTLARFGTSQATGLSPKTIETIINNPKEFSAKEASGFTREGIASEVKTGIEQRLNDLSELGKGYEVVRNSEAKVNIPIETVGDILNKYKVEIDPKGRVQTSQESLPMSAGDKAALQDFIDTFNTTQLSANAFLNARTALSNMAKFDASKTNASTTFARELRAAYDSAGKEQIKGLAELDKAFSSERNALARIKRDYLNADGTFKDGAVSKIANLNKAGREQVLARLEAILPGIGKKLSILNALEDIVSAQGQKVGTYGRAALGGVGLATFNIPAIVAAILATPSIAAQILRGYGKLKGIKTEVVEKTIKNVEKILTSDVSDLTKKANIGLSIKDVSQSKGKKIKPNSQNPLDDTGSAAKNRLNKYETQALKDAKSDSLTTEARKYKSAEEFVTKSTELTYKNLQENPYSIKAYGKDFNEPVIYHRAGEIRNNGDIWLTDNVAGASQYAKAGGTTTGEYIVQSKKPLIIDAVGGKYAKGNIDVKKILNQDEISKGYTNNPDIKKKFIDYAKKNGYDSVQFADSFPDGQGGMKSLVVWNKDIVKTKSQLTDIWKKANKK